MDSATVAFRAVGITPEQCALVLVAEALRPWPMASMEPWTVHLTVAPSAATARRLRSEGARDAIDAGSTLMATDDLDLVTYAATRADLEAAPLAWDRTYLRLSPGSTSALGAGAGPDAVSVDARPSEPPACNRVLTGPGSDTARQTSRRVVYDAADRTARALAERVVALTERPDVTAAGLASVDLDISVRDGDELAYIVSVPSSHYCDALATLAQRAPWITARSVVPLIDTRAYSIAPRAPRP